MAKKEEKKKKELGASVAFTISEMKKRFGEDSIMKLDQKPISGLDSISTGSFGLDLALGIGGLPLGRVVEIYGQESTGKTTLALHTVAEAQKRGGICAYIDAEHAMDPEYAKKIGVKTNELYISQPSCGEDALSMVEAFVQSGKFAVVVVDSVASLTPKAEIEGEMGDQMIGRQAKMMSQAMRKLVAIIANTKTIVIFINQLRQNIGVVGYGPLYFTPGGKALKFYASVRLEISRIAQIKKGEEVVGGRARIKVVKNKVAPPFKQTEFDLLYGEGISKEGEILALGSKYGIVDKIGNTFSYSDTKLGVGYDKARTFLKQNVELSQKITAEILEKIKADSGIEGEIDITNNNDGE